MSNVPSFDYVNFLFNFSYFEIFLDNMFRLILEFILSLGVFKTAFHY